MKAAFELLSVTDKMADGEFDIDAVVASLIEKFGQEPSKVGEKRKAEPGEDVKGEDLEEIDEADGGSPKPKKKKREKNTRRRKKSSFRRKRRCSGASSSKRSRTKPRVQGRIRLSPSVKRAQCSKPKPKKSKMLWTSAYQNPRWTYFALFLCTRTGKRRPRSFRRDS